MTIPSFRDAAISRSRAPKCQAASSSNRVNCSSRSCVAIAARSSSRGVTRLLLPPSPLSYIAYPLTPESSFSSEQIAMGPALHPVRVWFEEQECGPCAKFAKDGPLFACAGGRLKIAESVTAPGQLDANIRCFNPGAILHEKIAESHGGSDLE